MSKELTRAGAVGGEHTSAGGRLVSVDGRMLPLRSVALRGDASGAEDQVTGRRDRAVRETGCRGW